VLPGVATAPRQPLVGLAALLAGVGALAAAHAVRAGLPDPAAVGDAGRLAGALAAGALGLLYLALAAAAGVEEP
jgi:hypothetical protein